MNAYVYCWNLRPDEGLALELRVTASSVAVARRAVRRFLVEHDAVAWSVECVSRQTFDASFPLLTPPPAQAGSARTGWIQHEEDSAHPRGHRSGPSG